MLGKAPRINISDENESIRVNTMFNDIGKENISIEKFCINEQFFTLIHFKNYNPNTSSHCLNLCANERRVTSTNLQNVFNGVNSKFSSENGDYVYNVYITSEYLDNNVNKERTAFTI